MYSLLYVDDEPGLLEIGRLFLEQTGEFTVTCALSAKEGLGLLGRNSFDAIIADYQMPGMDGIELLKEVRTSHGQIPFILFTGRGREEIVIAAINNGADFYLQKGGEPKAQFAELAHKLRQAIGRTHAEKALSDSEKRLADIINFLPDATLAIDTKGTVIAWNRAIEEMTGTAAADILGRGNYECSVAFYGKRRPMLIDLVFAPDGQFEQAHYLYTRHTPTTLTAETVFEREGHPPVHLWGKASRLFNEKGELTGAIESIRDITDMKKSEIELRAANEQLAASGEELRSQYNELAANEKKFQESEEKYRTLVEHSQDGIFITQDGHLVFHNRGFREILGYAEGELDGISIDRCLAPEDREMVLARHYARLSGNRLPEVYECLFLNRDGTRRRVKMDVGLASYRGKPATIGTIRDVTEERLREEELRVSEEKYRSLVENIQDVIYRTDREGRLTMVSPSGAALLGYDSPDDLLGKTIADSFYQVPENRQEFLDELYRNGSVKNVEIELRHRDGTPVLVSTSSHLYYDRDGAVLGIEGILHDITRLKQKEDELKSTYEKIAADEEELRSQYDELEKNEHEIRESEAKYRSLIENCTDAIYIHWESRFLFFNRVMVDLYGYTPEELETMPVSDLLSSQDRERVKAFNDELISGKVQQSRFTAQTVTKAGNIRIFEFTESLIPYEGKTAILGEGRDITEQTLNRDKLLEERIFSDAVIDSVPGLLYLYDENGLLVRWNKNHETATGYTHEELAGVHLMDWYKGDEQTSALIRERVKKALEEGFADAEVKLTLKDGRKTWYYFTAVPLEIAGKKYFTGIGIDISARKEAEQKIQESRMQLDEIAATMPGVVYQFYARKDGSRGISYYGGRAKEIFGVPDTVPDFLSWITDHVHPDDKQPFLDSIEAALAKNGPWHFEARFVKSSGETIWFDGSASPVRHGDEQIYSGVLTDITQRKLAELALYKSEEKYRELVENANTIILKWDRNGTITFFNEYAQQFFGYTNEEILGKPIVGTIVPPTESGSERDLARMIEEIIQSPEKYSHNENENAKKNGERVWIQWRNKPLFDDKGGFAGLLSIGTDITEQRRISSALLESEEKYRLLAENSPNSIIFVDTGGYLRYANTTAAAVLNSEPGAVIGKHVTEIYGREAATRRLDLLNQVIENRTPVQKEIFEILPSGKIWLDARLSPVIDTAGRILGVLVISHDISDRKQTEEELRESEMKYRLLVENSHDIIYTLNSKGIFTFISPVWTTLLGHPVSEVIGKPFQMFVHPLDVPPCEAFLSEVVKTGKPRAGCVYRVFHADGSIRLHSSNISPFFDERGALIDYIGTAQDITDVRQSENAIREANRKLNLLNSITRHDVANQLTVMQGYTQLAAQRKPEPAVADFLRKIDTAVNVIQRQIEFMRTYQDLGVKAPAWHRLDELVSAARIPDITVTSACGTVEIFCDPMIGRVFFNLFDNAVRHGKTVTHIAVQCEHVSEDLVITVEDNGTGIPPDEKQRIFDKGFGKHTGFGLFLVREILAITGISIHETGTPGKGARFEITVPKGAYRFAAD